MDDTAAAAGHRRALRGDGTRNNRRFGRTRRGAAGWETLSGRTAGRRAEVSWAARGAERWARGDGDVCATNAPRPPSRPRPLPAPSPSPPRPPPVRSAGRAARSATRANMSGRSRSEPRLRSGTPRMGLRLMTPQPGFAACRCPGPVLTEVTALGVCIIPGTASGADGSGPAVPTRSCAAAVRDRGGEPTEGPTVGLHGAFPSSRTDQTRRGQRRAEPTVTPSAEVEILDVCPRQRKENKDFTHGQEKASAHQHERRHVGAGTGMEQLCGVSSSCMEKLKARGCHAVPEQPSSQQDGNPHRRI
ncbi:translation initiation factor IF-2-like isoform X1 [Gallus gallus]|uniref:translation initiation factor IF-2-like isoform X1 n=1 Tax=Gallus gallus TaxID=9031 RepID=UPI000D6401CD|nr:translation initiation factor IF-2-like isoform X1 [Gallus gallus]|eukprot:XP_025000133.1 uncharacterized protein LOC112530443 isoform X2 [Gallus gallus]